MVIDYRRVAYGFEPSCAKDLLTMRELIVSLANESGVLDKRICPSCWHVTVNVINGADTYEVCLNRDCRNRVHFTNDPNTKGGYRNLTSEFHSYLNREGDDNDGWLSDMPNWKSTASNYTPTKKVLIPPIVDTIKVEGLGEEWK